MCYIIYWIVCITCVNVDLLINMHSEKQKQYWPYNESHWGPMLFWFPLTYSVWEKTLETFFKISSLVFHRGKQDIFGMTWVWVTSGRIGWIPHLLKKKKKGLHFPLSVSMSDTHTLRGSRGSPRSVDRHCMYYIDTPVSALFKHCYSTQKCT